MSYTQESHTKVLDLGTVLVNMERDKEKWKTVAIIFIGLQLFLCVVAAFVLYRWRACAWQRKHYQNDFSCCLARTSGFKNSWEELSTNDEERTAPEPIDNFQTSLLHPSSSPLLTHDGTARTGHPPGRTELRKRTSSRVQRLEFGGDQASVDCALQHKRQQKSQSEKRTVPPPQGQKIQFNVYQNEKIYALPPLQDPLTWQQGGTEACCSDIKGEDVEITESKANVIYRLYQSLSSTVRVGDPPAFLFTQALPCCVHAIIYHKKCGAMIVKVNALESVDATSRSQLKQAVKDLVNARQRLQEELHDQLQPDGVTLLLALPILKSEFDLEKKDKICLDKEGVQLLVGRTEPEFETFLQTKQHREAWGRGGDSDEDFRAAVSKYLSMRSYGDSEDPPSWLVTPEQAAVLHCTDKLLHIHGPPGSGKTLLLLDRVRRWLLRGKTVVLVVCGPSHELLLHHLGGMALSAAAEDAKRRLKLCVNAKELKQTLASLGGMTNSSSICLAVDTIDSDFLPALSSSVRSSVVECAWTTSTAALPKSEEFKKLGGRDARLSCSLRCAPETLKLAEKLTPSDEEATSWTVFTHPPASPSSANVKVMLYHSHFGHHATTPPSFDCVRCSRFLKSSLPPVAEGVPLHLEQRKRWVVLMTGSWGPDSQLTEKLVSCLRRHGLPAVCEWQSSPGLSGSPPHQRAPDKATKQARVVSSVDKAGRPAVHVMRGSLFRGLEKPCVLVVHYDWRDAHPDHQSHELRDARLQQHRQQLYAAITRCRTRLAVLLLSPSPAASLLT